MTENQDVTPDLLSSAINPDTLHKLETHIQDLACSTHPSSGSGVSDENLEILLKALGKRNHHMWPSNASQLADHRAAAPHPAVCFTDLSVKGRHSHATQSIPSIIRFAIPLFIKNIFSKKQYPTILSNIDGIVYPGEMLLVLGTNDAGCSTLLKTLSGQTNDFSSITGKINYDPLSLYDLGKSPFKSQIIYNCSRK